MAQIKLQGQLCMLITQKAGEKFPNIQCMINTQLVKWVQRYFRKSDHNWTLPFEYFFRPNGGKTIIVSNFVIGKLPKLEDIPPFYVDLLKAWSKTDVHYRMVVDDKSQVSILTQCVWNNQFILVGKKSLYCKALHEAGLCYIYQLFDKSAWRNSPV